MTFKYSVDLYPNEGEEVLLSNVSLLETFCFARINGREMLTFSFIVHYTLMIQGVQESFEQIPNLT